MVSLESKLVREGNENTTENGQQIRSLWWWGIGGVRLFEKNEISKGKLENKKTSERVSFGKGKTRI